MALRPRLSPGLLFSLTGVVSVRPWENLSKLLGRSGDEYHRPRRWLLKHPMTDLRSRAVNSPRRGRRSGGMT